MEKLNHPASKSNTRLTTALQCRRSRNAAIKNFFTEHLGEKVPTMFLHVKFGSGFRARACEINGDPDSPIRILNKTSAGRDVNGQPVERSVYWGELKHTESDYMRRRRAEESASLPLFAGVE